MNFLFRFSLPLLIAFFSSCSQPKTTDIQESHEILVRHAVDSIGFAIHDWQMDSVIARINRLQADSLHEFYMPDQLPWKVCIVPHDDYSYVGYQYLNEQMKDPPLKGNFNPYISFNKTFLFDSDIISEKSLSIFFNF